MWKLLHEPENGGQPWVIYRVTGKTKEFKAAFSSKERAEEWLRKYGDRRT